MFGKNGPNVTAWWAVRPNSPEFEELDLPEPEKALALIEQYDPESEFVFIAFYIQPGFHGD